MLLVYIKTFFLITKNSLYTFFNHNNQVVVDFKGKSELFNLLFAKQCNLIETRINLPTQILCRTNKSLNTIHFIENDMLSVIRKLDLNKAHEHDQISICIL